MDTLWVHHSSKLYALMQVSTSSLISETRCSLKWLILQSGSSKSNQAELAADLSFLCNLMQFKPNLKLNSVSRIISCGNLKAKMKHLLFTKKQLNRGDHQF